VLEEHGPRPSVPRVTLTVRLPVIGEEVMIRTKLIWLIVVGTALVLPTASDSELVHGFAECAFVSWDFSEFAVSGWYEPDVTVIHVLDENYYPRDFVIAYGGAGVTMVGGSTLDDVLMAPEDPAVYVGQLDAYVFIHPYVVRTAEGHYAKFMILDTIRGYIEYVYQTDGSRLLTPTVPTPVTTWGAIKALFG
jgi:hypothetical protein